MARVIDPARWAIHAACRGAETDLWFPERGGSLREAREVCGRCPVRGACLDYAIANGEHHGIWGGLSERERRRLRTEEIAAERAAAVEVTAVG